MIEKLIEYSIRNRLLVLILAGALAAWAIYAVLQTPVDAIPDLSENQVIVFTDWMGRSPQEIEDQITYPLSLKLQGLAGVKAVRSSSEFNFSMITLIFEDNVDFYFARQRVLERLTAGQHVPARRRRALPGRRTPPRSARSSGTRSKAASWTPAAAGPCRSSYVGPETQLGARRGRGRRRRRHAARVPDRRRSQRPARLWDHARRAVRRRGPQQLGRRRPRHPEEQRRVSGPQRRLDRERAGHREHGQSPSAAARRSTSRTWPRCSSAHSSAAASSRRTATRSSAASC